MNKERLKEISRYLTDLSFIRRNVEDTPEMSNEEIMIRQLLIECLDLKEQNNNLQHKLKEKDKIIDEIEKRCNQEINAATIQYERHKRNDTWQYIIAHKRVLEILGRGKNGK